MKNSPISSASVLEPPFLFGSPSGKLPSSAAAASLERRQRTFACRKEPTVSVIFTGGLPLVIVGDGRW